MAILNFDLNVRDTDDIRKVKALSIAVHRLLKHYSKIDTIFNMSYISTMTLSKIKFALLKEEQAKDEFKILKRRSCSQDNNALYSNQISKITL